MWSLCPPPTFRAEHGLATSYINSYSFLYFKDEPIQKNKGLRFLLLIKTRDRLKLPLTVSAQSQTVTHSLRPETLFVLKELSLT